MTTVNRNLVSGFNTVINLIISVIPNLRGQQPTKQIAIWKLKAKHSLFERSGTEFSEKKTVAGFRYLSFVKVYSNPRA